MLREGTKLRKFLDSEVEPYLLAQWAIPLNKILTHLGIATNINM